MASNPDRFDIDVGYHDPVMPADPVPTPESDAYDAERLDAYGTTRSEREYYATLGRLARRDRIAQREAVEATGTPAPQPADTDGGAR